MSDDVTSDAAGCRPWRTWRRSPASPGRPSRGSSTASATSTRSCTTVVWNAVDADRLRAQPGRPLAGHPPHRHGRPGRLRLGEPRRRPVHEPVLHRPVLRPGRRRPAERAAPGRASTWRCSSSAPTRPARRLVGDLRQGQADGAVVLSLHPDDTLPQLLTEAGLPAVLIGRPADAAADQLRRRRQRPRRRTRRRPPASPAAGSRIGMITGPLDVPASQDRLTGFRQAMARHGHAYVPSVEGNFTHESGERAMQRLLAEHPELDGVFVANDLMAQGALSGAARSRPAGARRRGGHRLRRQQRRAGRPPAADHRAPAAGGHGGGGGPPAAGPHRRPAAAASPRSSSSPPWWCGPHREGRGPY